MDGVNAAADAGVTTFRTTEGRLSLRRSIVDQVPVAETATLESVVEADPVTHFMSQSLQDLL